MMARLLTVIPIMNDTFCFVAMAVRLKSQVSSTIASDSPPWLLCSTWFPIYLLLRMRRLYR